LLLLSCIGAAPAIENDAALRERAERIHRDAIVLDAHNDVPTLCLDYGFDLGMDGADPKKRRAAIYWVLGWLLRRPFADEIRTETDLRRLQAGGVDAQFFSIFVDSRYVPEKAAQAGRAKRRALNMIGVVYEQVRRHPDELELAKSVADVRRNAAKGKIAALMGLEGGHAIEDDLANLREFYDQGVRYMTLTWQNTNNWADSSTDDHRHGGLTDFGREVVREMNRLGMIVDVSHASDETFFDTIEVSRAPVMASHSSARAIADIPRNMSDEMLQAVARNGGVVMVNFAGHSIDPHKTGYWKTCWNWVSNFGWVDTPLELLVDHIDHIVAVAGIDHVGLGSDFDGALFYPKGIKDVSGFPNITLELLRRGYSDEEVRKILGENALRVFSDVESVAETMRAQELSETTAQPAH